VAGGKAAVMGGNWAVLRCGVEALTVYFEDIEFAVRVQKSRFANFRV
jgi:hypothetical protein